MRAETDFQKHLGRLRRFSKFWDEFAERVQFDEECLTKLCSKCAERPSMLSSGNGCKTKFFSSGKVAKHF